MNPPWVYTCSPSWTPLPPPSPYHPSGSSQCTSPEHPVSWIEPGLVICFTYDVIHVSMPFSQIIPPSPSPTESKRLFYTSVSLLLSCIQDYHYHLSKFHTYALVYCIGVFFFLAYFTAGSQHGESRLWERSWGRGHDKTQRRDQASGFPLDFLEHLPPKQESACFTVLCFPPTLLSLTGGCPPTTFLWKKKLI